jgi:hypothetical protein
MFYCKILSQVMKKAKRICYDKQILESDCEEKLVEGAVKIVGCSQKQCSLSVV